MDLQHTFTVPAPIDTAWATLLDLEGIAPCFPGAALTGMDGDEFTGTVKVKLGPISLQYSGTGTFVGRDESSHTATIEASGRDKRGNGTAAASVVARLEAEGESSTKVVVDTDLKVTGRPAQFGRGLIQDVSNKILDQFATCLAERMTAPRAGEAAAATPEDAAPVPPPAAEPAGGPADVPPSPAEAPSAEAPSAEAPSAEAPSAEAPSAAAPPTPAAAPAAAPGPRPTAPADAAPPSRPRPAPVASEPLDLNAVVLPVLARQYGPTVLAVLVTAVLTWVVARRRG